MVGQPKDGSTSGPVSQVTRAVVQLVETFRGSLCTDAGDPPTGSPTTRSHDDEEAPVPDNDVQPAQPAYRDAALSAGVRARDLLALLTLAEKISLLHQHAPAVERLGLAAFHTGSEVLHGVAWLGTATVFPNPSASPRPGTPTCSPGSARSSAPSCAPSTRRTRP